MSIPLKVLSLLSQGGYGDLYLARRADTGEQVVVKFLREDSTYTRRGFEREVRLLRLNNTGLVSVLDANLSATPPYYVMPYFQAGSLKRYTGSLSLRQLVAVAQQLSGTLAALHSQGAAHGDIKPDNILVANDGNLRIADPLGNGSVFTMLLSPNCGGTPGYCAPEVCQGKSISSAADVYSYGATLFHLLTGVQPFSGIDFGQHLMARKASPLTEVIWRSCQASPAERPSMLEVQQMLGGAPWSKITAQRRQVSANAGLALAALALGFLALSALPQK